MEQAGGAGAVLARAASFTATVGVIGAVVFWRFVVHLEVPAAALARRIGSLSAQTLMVVVPLRVVLQAKGLSFDGDPWSPMVSRVLSTAWGHAAIWQMAGALIAGTGFWNVGRGRPGGWWQARVGAAVLTVVPAFMGHATAVEQGRVWAIGADVLHVAAGGGWAGGLGIVTLFALSLRHDPAGGVTTAAMIDRFHGLAKRSVIILALTGLIRAAYHLTTVGDLTTSVYGQTLAVKLALVSAALVLGWRHSRTGASRARAAGAAAVTRSLTGEWILLLAVLAVTSVLAGSPPPGD